MFNKHISNSLQFTFKKGGCESHPFIGECTFGCEPSTFSLSSRVLSWTELEVAVGWTALHEAFVWSLSSIAKDKHFIWGCDRDSAGLMSGRFCCSSFSRRSEGFFKRPMSALTLTLGCDFELALVSDETLWQRFLYLGLQIMAGKITGAGWGRRGT